MKLAFGGENFKLASGCMWQQGRGRGGEGIVSLPEIRTISAPKYFLTLVCYCFWDSFPVGNRNISMDIICRGNVNPEKISTGSTNCMLLASLRARD